jgi:hypothetical protein
MNQAAQEEPTRRSRGLLLGGFVALLLAGVVALAQTLSVSAEQHCLECCANHAANSSEELPVKALSDSPLTGSLLPNGGFEDGVYCPALSPEHWAPDSWASGATFSWESIQSFQGSKSIRISLATPNDARWIQTAPVLPNTEYRLSGWIKTEGVAQAEPVDAGANLCVYGTWTRTAALTGTNDWTYVSLTFNTGSSTEVTIAARLGYWSGITTGTAWFDQVRLELVQQAPRPDAVFLPLISSSEARSLPSMGPSWRILVLVYESTDFIFTDGQGQQHHFVAAMTPTDKDKVEYASTRFVSSDIPALDTCNMVASLSIRYPPHALSDLSLMADGNYAPSPSDAAPDRDPAFDSVITVWDGTGTDLTTGESMSIYGCAWSWPMGTGQTYVAIPADAVRYNNRNIFKHEWGHSILFYYDAAGTAPKPPVDNHINDTDNRYVNCTTEQSYVLQDETDDNPIPNSIYHNESGFTHDYYSGLTARAEQPSRCLGITASAWASGGPVSGPLSGTLDVEDRWRGPSDDVLTTPVPACWDG